MFVADIVLKSENLDTFNFNLGRNNKVTWGCAYVLSHFGPVQIFAPLWTVAHQARLSLGFPRQEYWSGLPCPPPLVPRVCAKLLQSCLTLSNPMDHSPSDSYVHGILQV